MGVTAAVAAVVGTTYSVYQGEEAKKQQNRALQMQAQANEQARTTAERQQATAEQNMAKANQKRPDTASILSEAGQAARGGAAGTMLTGTTGIDPSQLTLGKNTLLGG